MYNQAYKSLVSHILFRIMKQITKIKLRDCIHWLNKTQIITIISQCIEKLGN